MKSFIVLFSLFLSMSSFAAYEGLNTDIIVAQKCGSSYPGHLKLRALAKKKIKAQCQEIGTVAKKIDMYMLGVAEKEQDGKKCRKHAYEVRFYCR